MFTLPFSTGGICSKHIVCSIWTQTSFYTSYMSKSTSTPSESLGTSPCGMFLVSDKGAHRPQSREVELRIMQEPKETQEGNPRGSPNQISQKYINKLEYDVGRWRWGQGRTKEVQLQRAWKRSKGLQRRPLIEACGAS